MEKVPDKVEDFDENFKQFEDFPKLVKSQPVKAQSQATKKKKQRKESIEAIQSIERFFKKKLEVQQRSRDCRALARS